ncbi:helix-turn-helix transcriptional regulator [Halotia wernerae UHCC 0503]|nr:helix-turn-helix transcriptional regulator [Halotia wernerae UHCC 0503]
MPVLVKLKNAREIKGLSQNELARRTGYSLQNIQKIEQNRAASITFNALGKFCQVLECQPGDILEWEPDNNDDESSLSSTKEIAQTALNGIDAKSNLSKRANRQANIIVFDGNKGAA